MPAVKSNENSALSEYEEPTLMDVLKAVQQCHVSLGALTGQVQGFREDFILLHQDVQKVRECTTALEGPLCDLEDKIQPISMDVKNAMKKIYINTRKLKDLENCLQCNNLRMLGLPEQGEGANPTEFAEIWLWEILGKEHLSITFSVERAHHVPTRPLPSGSPPRPFLKWLLNYQDRKLILKRVRTLKECFHQRSKSHVLPGFLCRSTKAAK